MNYIVLDSKGQGIGEQEALHPGYIIDLEIGAREIKKKEVAEKLSIQPHHLSEILKEKRNISAKMAVRLEEVFDIPAEYWLRVQNAYDLFQIRHNSK